MRPEGAAGPIVHFADGADGAGPYPFTEEASVFGSLIANGDLRGDAGFAGDIGDAAGFVDGVREGLLAENVFVFAHGRGGNGGVEMVGGADDDGVEVFFFFEEFAVIGIGRTAA